MRAGLRAHVTVANVVSFTALFVALGGGAYALTIPKNSVGPQQLKNGAVTSAKVKDRSLRAKDFRRGVLRSGPQGPAGPRGPAGPSTGPASGVLAGDYPSPRFAADVGRLVPVAVVLINAAGTVASEAHRAPVTGPPTVITSADSSTYRLYFPGYVAGGNDIVVCTLRGASGEIQAETFGSGHVEVTTYASNGAQTPTGKPFQCAVYNL